VGLGRFLWSQLGEVLRKRRPSGKTPFRLLDSHFHLRSNRRCSCRQRADFCGVKGNEQPEHASSVSAGNVPWPADAEAL
jgi:hypothetical protein